MVLKLGKKLFAPKKTDLLFARYADKSLLPFVPRTFGHYGLIATNAWGMLGNDEYGDCVFAGADHETMLWTAAGGNPATFTPANALSDYSAVTGFDPNNPSTDHGADPRSSYSYRQKTGLIDASGKRHRIGAYLLLNQDDINEVHLSTYLFEATGIGLRAPSTMIDQFNAGQPWDIVPGATDTGEGHYVSYLGFDGAYMWVVTWGKLQAMTPRFFLAYCDEAWAILSEEMLRGGVSLDGFSLAQLQKDLASLNNTPIPGPAPAVGNVVTVTLLLHIDPAPIPALAIMTTDLPSDTEGLSYEVGVQAAGGVPPYTWSATGLPAGLSIDPSSGMIAGIPTENGDFFVAITVTDSAGLQVHL